MSSVKIACTCACICMGMWICVCVTCLISKFEWMWFSHFLERTSRIWIGPTDIKFGVNIHSDKCYMSQCPDISWKPNFGPSFWRLENPNCRVSLTQNINSNQKPVNEIRMCDVRQIVSVIVSLWAENQILEEILGLKSPLNGGLIFFWFLILPESHYCLPDIIIVYAK